MARHLKIDARHYHEVHRLVERGDTPEEAIAKVAARQAKPRSRRRRSSVRELGREATAADYHALITEQAFTTQTIKLAEGYGWYAYHDQDSRKNVAGFPDLYLAHPVHGIVQVELKTETGAIRPEQMRVLRLIRQAGGRAFIARPRHRTQLEELLAGRDPGDEAFELPSGAE